MPGIWCRVQSWGEGPKQERIPFLWVHTGLTLRVIVLSRVRAKVIQIVCRQNKSQESVCLGEASPSCPQQEPLCLQRWNETSRRMRCPPSLLLAHHKNTLAQNWAPRITTSITPTTASHSFTHSTNIYSAPAVCLALCYAKEAHSRLGETDVTTNTVEWDVSDP